MNNLSVVIPSYKRGSVLLDTVEFLRAQESQADEIIVVDQTKYADSDSVFIKLKKLDDQKIIRWLRRDEPSIPKAMNHGLLNAKNDYVLFLDDDIKLATTFISAHIKAFKKHDCAAQVGQVLQPKQLPCSLPKGYSPGEGVMADMEFVFSSDKATFIQNCMAGNLCVKRQDALDVGGFDENFVGAAYRFETEFCRRLIRFTSKPFYFFPDAVLYHLQYASGGTRHVGHQLIASSAHHSVGDYYYAMLESSGITCMRYCLIRFIFSIKAKFYLKKPWYIPVRLVAEVRGYFLARKLKKQGPSLLSEY